MISPQFWIAVMFYVVTVASQKFILGHELIMMVTFPGAAKWQFSPCKQAVPSSNSERQSQQSGDLQISFFFHPPNKIWWWFAVLSIVKCKVTMSSAGQGDNMEREAGAETTDGMTTIFSKLSRTKDGRIVDLLCDNGGAAKAVNSSILRTDKDTHGVQTNHEKRMDPMDSSSQINHVPGFNSSQQLQKIISSMNKIKNVVINFIIIWLHILNSAGKGFWLNILKICICCT